MPAMALDEFFTYVLWIQGQFLKTLKKVAYQLIFCPRFITILSFLVCSIKLW